MPVRVRFFAALREAAGTDEVLVEPGPLPALLDGLARRYGEPFSARLGLASVLLDGTPVARRAAIDVADGAEVALLPPVSGGARRSSVRCVGPARPAGEALDSAPPSVDCPL